ASLPAYEISNHARPGAECRHNLVYWRGHDYAGIGPGAHGRLTIDGRRIATETEKRPEAWLMRVETSGAGLTVSEKLTAGETADEYLLMGLRLVEGIDLERYKALSGRTLDPERISFLRDEGAVETTADGRLRVTQSGFPLLDAVVADLAACSLCPRRKGFRRGADHLAAGRSYAQDRKSALVRSLRAEAENTIDPCEPGRISEDLLAKALHPLRLDESCHQRDRVIGECCRAHRVLSVAGAVPTREVTESGLLGRRIPTAIEQFLRRDPRIVAPQSGSEQLHALEVDTVGGECLRDLWHRIWTVGNEDAVDLAGRLRNAAHGLRRPVGVVWVFFQHHDPSAVTGYFLLECRFHYGAVCIVGHQRGKRPFATRGRIRDDPADVSLGQETQQVDAACSDARIRGEGDDRYVARPRDLANRAHRLGKERAYDDLRPF